jgi:hypothetical protein
MAPRLGLRLNEARILLGPLRGKYFAPYLKMDVGGGEKTLKYINPMKNMML